MLKQTLAALFTVGVPMLSAMAGEPVDISAIGQIQCKVQSPCAPLLVEALGGCVGDTVLIQNSINVPTEFAIKQIGKTPVDSNGSEIPVLVVPVRSDKVSFDGAESLVIGSDMSGLRPLYAVTVSKKDSSATLFISPGFRYRMECTQSLSF